MSDKARISVVSSAESALKKLSNSKIAVYDCKKCGARFIFSVKDKHIKKVFAIFNKPCYNICVETNSPRSRVKLALFQRIGLIIGSVIFISGVIFSSSFIFKISVSGSGAYLSPEVKKIASECGFREFSYFSNFDFPSATGKILSLPNVSFCSIKKRGSILCVDVEVTNERVETSVQAPLKSDRRGTVKNLVAICGTAKFNVGDEVSVGDTLIAPYKTVGEENIKSIAVGYAELVCAARTEYFAAEESDANLFNAYKSLLLYSDEILSKTYKVEPCEGGVNYVIDFTYLHKLSINME